MGSNVSRSSLDYISVVETVIMMAAEHASTVTVSVGVAQMKPFQSSKRLIGDTAAVLCPSWRKQTQLFGGINR
ncbi:MAG: hypothetical protein ACE5K1_00380 [Acidiferrobacterales bacterium]